MDFGSILVPILMTLGSLLGVCGNSENRHPSCTIIKFSRFQGVNFRTFSVTFLNLGSGTVFSRFFVISGLLLESLGLPLGTLLPYLFFIIFLVIFRSLRGGGTF